MRDWMGGLPNTDLNASVNACCRVRLFASAYSLMFIALSFHQELDWGFRGLFPVSPQSPLKLSTLCVLYHAKHPLAGAGKWVYASGKWRLLGRGRYLISVARFLLIISRSFFNLFSWKIEKTVSQTLFVSSSENPKPCPFSLISPTTCPNFSTQIFAYPWISFSLIKRLGEDSRLSIVCPCLLVSILLRNERRQSPSSFL